MYALHQKPLRNRIVQAQPCKTACALFQVDHVMAERMATWVAWAIINSHRRLDWYLQSQQRKEWPKLQLPDNGEVRVIVLGNGVMGSASALALKQLGVIL